MTDSLFARAQQVIPGGVNSPVRAFGSVGGSPVFMKRGRGAVMETTDGRKLLDFCGSWGPLLFGHAHPVIVAAVTKACESGLSFGAATEAEVLLAERLTERVQTMEQVRLVNSGTEAVMTALRIARGATGRDIILKCDGCYHGHVDAMLVAAGSGLLTGGIASSAGVGADTAQHTRVVPFNDLPSAREVVSAQGDRIAAIIVEPVAGNMGLVAPGDGFLSGLRELADACGAVLIFDEVITGFRLGPTTYGDLCGVAPDLTCLGKIMGGGMPIGAVGGRGDLMACLAPCGDVYQAGTLSGNPVAVAAGLAMLDLIENESPYERLSTMTASLGQGVRKAASDRGVEVFVSQLGSMFTVFFCLGPVCNRADASRTDGGRYAAYFHAMLEQDIYLPPSAFEVCFVSAAHSEAHIEAFVAAAGKSFSS